MCSEADLIVMLGQFRCTVRQRAKLLNLHESLYHQQQSSVGAGASLQAQRILSHMKRHEPDLLKELIANLNSQTVIQEGPQQLAVVLKRCQRIVLQ